MIDPVENDLYRYERALDKEYAFDHAVEMLALDLFKEYKRDLSVLVEVLSEWIENATEDDIDYLSRRMSFFKLLFARAEKEATKQIEKKCMMIDNRTSHGTIQSAV